MGTRKLRAESEDPAQMSPLTMPPTQQASPPDLPLEHRGSKTFSVERRIMAKLRKTPVQAQHKCGMKTKTFWLTANRHAFTFRVSVGDA